MAVEKNINSRIQHKHDTAVNWEKAINFIPKDGELIIYDPDSININVRFKIGDGLTKINDLPFVIDVTAARDDYVNLIFDTYILNINYEELLGFDVTENVFSSVLNEGFLGTMVLNS